MAKRKKSKSAPPKDARTPRDWRALVRSPWLCAALVGIHVALGIGAAARVGLTFDEPAHLSSGYINLREGDYRWDPSHPPLAKMWMAIPLVLGHERLPDVMPRNLFGRDMFRSEATAWMTRRDPGARKLFWPRVMNLIFSAGAVVLVYFVLRRASPLAALIGAAWLALDPNVLAHAALVTTDACMLLLFPLALLSFWWASRCVNSGRVVLAGLTLGALLAAKFSGVLAVPVIVVLALSRVVSRPIHWRIGHHRVLRAGGGKLLAMLGLLAMVAFQSWLVVWASYRFRYAAGATGAPWSVDVLADPHFSDYYWIPGNISFEDLDRRLSSRTYRLFMGLRRWKIFPEAYTNGVFLLTMRAPRRHAFAIGQSWIGGRWYFYPLAFLLKTPISGLAMLGVAIVVAVAGWRRWPRFRRGATRSGWPAALGLGFYGGSAVLGTINIGLRHVLPIYPLLAMLAAVPFARWARKSQGGLGLAGLLGVWQLGAALWISPEFLTSFNLLAGGSESGYMWLVDSNLDWGQDLPKLVQYVKDHPEACPINLAYFGAARASAYDELKRCCRTCVTPTMDRNLQPAPQGAGTYVISATYLQGISLIGGDMTEDERIARYAKLDGDATKLGGDTSLQTWFEMAQLRFRSLITVLRRARLRGRFPDGRISDTLLIYEVTDEEILEAQRRG